MSESRLFEIPSTWSWAPLGEIAEVDLGKMLSAKAYEPGLLQLPYLRNQNVRWGSIDYSDVKLMGFKKSELDRYGLNAGDLLVCEGGEPGRCCVYGREYGELMYQKALHRIRPYGGLVLPQYLQFCLWNYAANSLVIPRASQTTIQHLPRERMLELLIPIAPLAEQERIVSELEKQFTRLDSAGATLARISAGLKRYRASVLGAAVEGRLVPTEAELAQAEGRESEVVLGQNSPTLLPDCDCSDLPPVPETWTWIELDRCLTRIEAGKNFKCAERPPSSGEVGVVKVSSVTWGVFDEDESKTCMQPNLIDKKLFINDGDFLFSRANTLPLVGACVIAERVQRRLMLSDKILRFHFTDIPPRWILHCLKSPHGRKEIERLATGNQESMRNITQENIRRIRIPLPPLEEVSRVNREIDRQLSIIDALDTTIASNLRRAKLLRQTMLRAAFSGSLVQQDLTDEPASLLLDQIRKSRESTADVRHRRGRGPWTKASPPDGPVETKAFEPARPPGAAEISDPEPVLGEADFLDLPREEQIDHVWESLLGQGPLDKDAAIRTAAQILRDRGLVQFQRLREGGPLHAAIAAAVDRGLRQGSFDRPKRGLVRALLPDAKDYTATEWNLCLLQSLDGQPVPQEEALRNAAEWAQETLGLSFSRLREDGVILRGLKAALDEAVKTGEVIRKAGMVSCPSD